MNKLTEEELKIINLIRQDALEIASALGELLFQKIAIELKIDEEKSKIKALKQKENTIFDEIKSKYGNVMINIESGEIS